MREGKAANRDVDRSVLDGQVPNVGADERQPGGVGSSAGKHLGRGIHRDDIMAETDQDPREATRAACDIQRSTGVELREEASNRWLLGLDQGIRLVVRLRPRSVGSVDIQVLDLDRVRRIVAGGQLLADGGKLGVCGLGIVERPAAKQRQPAEANGDALPSKVERHITTPSLVPSKQVSPCV